MKRALVFPGQGSQIVGMGKSLFDQETSAKQLFEEVNDALGLDLTKIMFEGPEDELKLTFNAQPALMAVSMAVVRTLEARGVMVSDVASYVAGHSLGEYSALAAAGTFSVGDTARLLRLRGEAMQRAVPVGEGAMAALLGLDFEVAVEVAELAADGQICSPANDNAKGQVVVSGHKAAVERAMAIAKDKGAIKSVLLPVSAPFHCPLMQPAADEMAEALAAVNMQDPAVPLIANVTADVVSDAATIRDLLVQQVTGSVRWRESVCKMVELGVEQLVEVGSGKVLSGLARRIDRSLTVVNIQDVDGAQAFSDSLK